MWASVLVIASTVFAPGVAQDTLVVRADNAPTWGTDLSLVEELRLGVLDGPVEEAFTEIRGFVTLDNGELWIGDGASVRRFTEGGRFIGELGREGEGPGEFRGIAGMKRMPDGRVVVFDPWVGRLSYFSPDGTFLSSSPRAIGVVLARHELFEVDSDGDLYHYWIRQDADSGRGIPMWYKLDEAGQPIDSIMGPPSGRTVLGGQSYQFGDFGAFSPRAMSVMSPLGYLVEGQNSEYALHYPLNDGRVVRIERAWDPIGVDPDERRQFRENAAHVASLWGPGSGLNDDIPAVKPPFWAFRVDGEGRFWVARHRVGTYEQESEAERESREDLAQFRGSAPPPVEWWEPLTIDVLEPQGRFLGSVTFPNRQSVLLDARDRTVWVTERGEFDEQYVVRYRIHASRREAAPDPQLLAPTERGEGVVVAAPGRQ